MQRPDHIPPFSARLAAIDMVCRLRQAGFVAYLAGGCVRDEVLGLTPKDYDVATDARPQQVRELFPNSRAVGQAFGVMLVTIRKFAIEVATFRTDGQYQDGRHPQQVQFTDAFHDAQRRDFTINGLFGDPSNPSPSGQITLKVIDYVGGLDDLKAGVIRAIGDPDQRLAEDYLRLLRAVRFAARFQFVLEPKTAAAIRIQARHLGQISRERIGQEIRWMLTGPRPHLAARLIQQLELDGPSFQEDHQDIALPTLEHLPSHASFALSLLAWMTDRQWPVDLDVSDGLRWMAHEGGLATLRQWRKALCLSNLECDQVICILSCVWDVLDWDSLSVAKKKRRLMQEGWQEAMAWMNAIARGKSNPTLAKYLNQVDTQAKELNRQGVNPEPLLTGADLLAAGWEPGPELGRLLSKVYDEQLEGRLATREQALNWLASQK